MKLLFSFIKPLGVGTHSLFTLNKIAPTVLHCIKTLEPSGQALHRTVLDTIYYTFLQIKKKYPADSSLFCRNLFLCFYLVA